MAVDTGTFEVVMPAMGDSVAEGTILEWHKQVGDEIAADETLVEISTDKVDAEVPSPVSGTITKIYGAEGDTVAVGAVLAEIASGNGAPAEATPVSGESPPVSAGEAVAGAATEAEGVAAGQSASGQVVEIVTPTGGESVTEGTILQWSVTVGDQVADGDALVEISTDKVDMELPAPVAGTITEILAQEGDTVSVGQVIGRMTTGAPAPGTTPAAGAPTTAPQPENQKSPAATGNGTANASPIARRIAAERGVDLASVRGSARGGRIMKADVLSAGNGASAPAKPAGWVGGAVLIKGGGAALARYMDESR